MPKPADFTHLHVHSEYSLLDGACRVDDIVAAACDHGMKSIAITDHGNMYAAIKFYKAAKHRGIHPLIGFEAYFARRSRHDKSTREDRSPHHITLLAKDETGYKNLLSLVTAANKEGFYQKPRVDKELLQKFNKGLVVLSGCIAGEIPELILAKEFEKAIDAAGEYKNIFGGDFYLEIMDNNLPGQREVTKGLAEIGQKLGISLVATNDVHYLKKEDARAQDVLLCIQTGKFVDEKDRMRFGSEEFYIKSSEEMYSLFPGMEVALKNTCEIAEKCNLKIEMGKMHLPDFPVKDGETPFSYLSEIARKGVKQRYGDNFSKEIESRLVHELEVIDKMGYAPFFLIVQDFTNFAKQKGIAVGPGRGSAAGSVVSYAIGITDVDPFKYGLIFERFLNIERVTMPDIDIDFCFERRQEVIDYVASKYGENHVAQIITFGTMAARAVIRDVGRVLRIPLIDVDRIAKLIPMGQDATIDSGIKSVKELKAAYDKDDSIRNLIDTAKTLEGMVRHASVHAAGIVISKMPLQNYVPLQISNETQAVTQYSMKDLENIGLLKMDFLGLRTLTMIGYAVQIIKKSRMIDLDIKNPKLDDKKTYKLFCDGETIGVFQLESQGMRALIKELKPDCFEDIIALLALYRPGPLESGMVQDFVQRKHGLKKVPYELKELEPILKETYGVILYQEQVMRIAMDIAGFTAGEADILRHAMGKKKPKEMARLREKFIEGSIKRKFSGKKATDLFDLCAKFAGYGFNKSHSTSYAIISYQTAYLKANYPIEFMAALLTSVSGVTDKVTFYIAECKRMNIPVLLPDINESAEDFTVASNSIRFGLHAVKNVGLAAVKSIIDLRGSSGNFTSFNNFLDRIDPRVVNKKVVESLIKCGAFDSFKIGRAALLSRYDKLSSKSNKAVHSQNHDQTMLFANSSGSQLPAHDEADSEVFEFSSEQLLRMEKEMIGLYISDHPLNHLGDAIKQRATSTIYESYEKKDGSIVKIGCVLSNTKKITTRKKEPMMVGDLQDLTGTIGFVAFPKSFEKYASILNGDTPLLIKGRVDSKGEEIKIICEEVELLEKIGSERSLHIAIAKGMSRNVLEQLKDVFKQSLGRENVFLHMDGRTILIDQFLIAINENIVSKIETLTGDGTVWIDFEREKGRVK